MLEVKSLRTINLKGNEMKLKTTTVANLAVLMLLSAALSALAKDVPAELPDPDGKPGDATKPVKVYILAGQSNMVGMGNLSGAKNMYTAMYYSADPAVPKGPLSIFRVGNYKIEPLAVSLPDGTPTDKPVAEGLLEVPVNGVYKDQCGTGDSSYNAMMLDGKEVYRRQPGGEPVKQEVTLEAGKRYAFKITGFQGAPPKFWLQKTDLQGHGDLETVTKRDKKFQHLVDDDGNWTVRKDVYFYEAELAFQGGWLTVPPRPGKNTIGPELQFGHIMGQFHDEQVLVIKTSNGNRSLGFDYRPPSSGRNDPDNEWEGKSYRLMVEGVRKTLNNLKDILPGYQGQGYEIAGFAWWQGHKDGGSSQEDYEKNLVNLINDVRAEFKVPKMPAVIATVGFGGHDMDDKYLQILNAQMAVSDPKKHPEFAGNVASVDIRDFWREVDESPKGEGHHYNRNAETYMLVGDSLGRAMVRLEGGNAEPLPQAPRPKHVVQLDTEPSEAEKASAQKALTSIVLDGIAADYIANPSYNQALLQEASGERPQRANQFLRGAMYGLLNCYHAVGISDYDWHVFGPDLRDVEWDYFTFDPPEAMPKERGGRYRKVTYPAGMENCFATDFDASKAGWKKGLQPFGQNDGKLEPIGGCERDGECGCGEKPKTLWDKEVLMARGTFEIPPLKDGYRYRIVVGGSNHVKTGEGYAIYVNGKLLAESRSGVPNRQGGQPRGGYVYTDFRDDFKGGKVTIAVTSFLQYNHRTSPGKPRGHLTVWLEEAKTPPMK
jgi:hypothetical protein